MTALQPGHVPTPQPAPAPVASTAPPARRPWVPPLVLGVTTLAATAYTGAVDPNTSHAFPLCPLRYFTHMDCPMCGALRSVHSLVHGDIVGAIDHNIVFVAALPFIVAGYLLWLGRSLGHDLPRPHLSTRALWSLLGVLLVFGVARNLPIPGHDLLNSTSVLAGRRP